MPPVGRAVHGWSAGDRRVDEAPSTSAPRPGGSAAPRSESRATAEELVADHREHLRLLQRFIEALEPYLPSCWPAGFAALAPSLEPRRLPARPGRGGRDRPRSNCSAIGARSSAAAGASPRLRARPRTRSSPRTGSDASSRCRTSVPARFGGSHRGFLGDLPMGRATALEQLRHLLLPRAVNAVPMEIRWPRIATWTPGRNTPITCSS